MMAERRGHRKLRLCSVKYYEKKKYCPKSLLVSIPRNSVSILPVSVPIDFVKFTVSLPLSCYTESAVPSLGILHDRVQLVKAIPQEWSANIGNSLCFYQLENTEVGPVTTFSVTIKSDFTWCAGYHSQLVPTQHCKQLQNMPSVINSVAKVTHLLSVLCKCTVCQGNSDEQFVSLPSIQDNLMRNQSRTAVIATLNSTRTGSLSIYHENCEVLIKNTPYVAPSRCESCKTFRQSLLVMASRVIKERDDRTHPSSHTNYRYLSSDEKDERLHRMHVQAKITGHQIKRLEERINNVVSENGVQLDDDLYDDLRKLTIDGTEQINELHQPDSFQRLFWNQQSKASSLKDSRSMKWHPLFIKWCLYLRHLSGKSYEMLRQSGCIKLPSQRTLRDYTHYITTTIGFSAEVDSDLVRVADLSQDLNKYVILIMDEVHIKEDLVYDKHEGCLIGFVNLGTINNQLLEFEAALSADKDYRPLAKTMLVFMVRGLFQKLNYPYAQFACANLSADLLFDPVWEAISRLEILGFKVLALTCDGASANRRLWKLHSKGNEATYKVQNPYAEEPSRPLFLISDPPHLLKTIRNSWYNKKRNLWCNGKDITWKHLEELYLLDTTSTNGLRLVPKLKYEHIHLTTFSKMRVDLAAQVLSETVANALEHTKGNEVEETVKFVRMIDKFFDCLNVNSFTQGKHKRKPFQEPYRSKDDFRIKWLKEEFLQYLQDWENSVEQRKRYTPKAKSRMLITKETRFGIYATVNSFVELVEYIFTIKGVKVFLSERLSQDPLEKFFGCQRQRGTTNENPNVVQFCKNTQALRVINGVCGNVSKSNCRGNKTSVNWGKENCPLPKRRKCIHSSSNKEEDSSDIVMSSLSNTMIETVPLTEHQDRLVGNSSNHEEDPSYIVMSSSNTMIEAIPLTEHQDDLVGNSLIKEEDPSDIVMSSSNTMIEAIPLTEHQDNYSLIKEEDPSDIVMSSSNTMIEAIPLTEHQNHLVGNSLIKEEDPSDIVMIQAVPLPEHQDHLVGNSSDHEEDPSDIVMTSSGTTKLNHNRISAQPVYPPVLIQLINNAIKFGRADEELSKSFHISLKRSDFWLLRETGWLNDKIINFYMRLITNQKPNIYALNTFFYPKLVAAGFDGVTNWVKEVNIFDMKLILVPIHLGTHWCLSTIDLSNHRFCYYDSMKGSNITCLQCLKEFMIKKASEMGVTQHNFLEWAAVHDSNIPMQTNSFDCGVFVCMYARKLAEEVPFGFSQRDIPAIRKHIVLELLLKKLL